MCHTKHLSLKNKILLSLWLLFLPLCVVAQDVESPRLIFYFRIGSSAISPEFGENHATIERLNKVLAPSNSIYIKAIRVSGSASPEGAFERNQRLSISRMSAVRSFILKRSPDITSIFNTEEETGINWNELRQLVEADLKTPRREEVLHIIDNVPEVDFTKNISRRKSLMDLGVASWGYLMKKHFPVLRSSAAVIIYMKANTPQVRIDHINAIIKGETTEINPSVETTVTVPTPTVRIIDTVFVEKVIYRRDTLLVGMPQGITQPVRPFALKTNLLFDAASILNVEVEVPVSKRWSVAGEWVFPWWLWEEKQHCLELLQGSLEVRYWLTNNYSRQDIRLGTHNPLTGWFVGLYGGGGYYDLEWDKAGYQGEFFIATGISAGYVKPLTRNLSLEFSLGVGYLKTNYRYYKARTDVQDDWHLIKQYSGNYTWIGPTKAKISLIWYPHFYKKVNTKK